uniref:Aconitase/3-isopropylmalate dehydratase large subunit alpha/beta/alpha domain-containing protein n=1 Tax=Spongospora subterranea TaxID=70186 RepID=A0A0H5QJE4_9EUKA|eukprot:CRZ01426.1 hypothetical protein [Spongospora subterranea]
MNQLEKIVSGYLLGGSTGVSSRIAAGQYVRVSPQHIMSHDNTAAIIPKFESLARNPTIHQPAQPVFALDHDIQNPNNFAGKYAAIKKFAQRHGVDFFPAGRGIGHQIMIEEAYALPGSMIVAPDSHSNMYGGVGCLGTPLTRTDAAVIWAIGNTWWKVPPVTRVVLTGSLPPGVTGKDVILALCSTFDSSRVLNHAIQFSGESAISSLSIEDRLTIANMTTEWGCLAGVFPVDDVLLTWLERRMNFLSDRGPAGTFSDPDRYLPEEKYYHPRLNPQSMLKITKSVSLNADPGARYAQTLEIDLSTVTPLVAGPNAVNNGIPISSLRENIHVDKAYILSCVNARNNDLQQAAAVLRGKKVADHVKLYVAAASSEVQERAVADGSWKVLQESGAIFLPSGCGPCIGLGAGLLADGEVGISKFFYQPLLSYLVLLLMDSGCALNMSQNHFFVSTHIVQVLRIVISKAGWGLVPLNVIYLIQQLWRHLQLPAESFPLMDRSPQFRPSPILPPDALPHPPISSAFLCRAGSRAD